MKTGHLITLLILLAVISCRRKTAEDYKYYQPQPKDTVQVIEEPKPVIEVVEAPKPEPDRGVDLVNHRYFIVVATYTVESFAKSQERELAKLGYKPAIFMLNENGWHKLAAESYKTRNEAQEALVRLKEKGGLFSNARIVFKSSRQ